LGPVAEHSTRNLKIQGLNLAIGCTGRDKVAKISSVSLLPSSYLFPSQLRFTIADLFSMKQ